MRITGESWMYGNALITGELEIGQIIKLPPPTLAPDQTPLLKLSATGVITTVTAGELIDAIAAALDYGCEYWDESDFRPSWRSLPGVVYVNSQPCGYDFKVGIGTHSPIVDFDVYHETRIKNHMVVGDDLIDPTIQLRLAPQSNVQTVLELTVPETKSGLVAKAYGVDDHVMVVQDALTGTDKFRVTGAGKVYSTGVYVRLPLEFPDYVFEDDYDLLSLYELEKFIKTNKRLPKMPTAEMVADSSLDLGENSRMLTEKVEELTLYILQLKHEIDSLSKEMQNLKAAQSKH